MTRDNRAIEKLNEEFFAIVGLEKVFLTFLNDALPVNNLEAFESRKDHHILCIDDGILKDVDVLLTEIGHSFGNVDIDVFIKVNFLAIRVKEVIFVLVWNSRIIKELIFFDLNLKGDISHILFFDLVDAPGHNFLLCSAFIFLKFF